MVLTFICTPSILNTIIEGFGQTQLCPYLNRCILLCFYSCVLLILCPPALHSAISRMRNRTFPCCGLIFSFLGTRLIISAGQNLLACRIVCNYSIHRDRRQAGWFSFIISQTILSNLMKFIITTIVGTQVSKAVT